MKQETKGFLYGLFLAFIAGMSFGGLLSTYEMRSRSIESGCGGYSHTNGHFDWCLKGEKNVVQ